jgi:hypothetical protein
MRLRNHNVAERLHEMIPEFSNELPVAITLSVSCAPCFLVSAPLTL